MTANPPARSTRAWLAVGALAFGAATLVACGDDDDSSAQPAVVEITAVDFAFEGVPEEVAAGSTLTLSNAADRELHELVAFRLADDETRSIDDLMALPPEELGAVLSGEPSMVLLAAPGGEQISAVGDGTLQEPGRYALVCMIPTGVEADAYLTAAATSDGPPDIDGGPPHIVHGMYSEINVS